MIRRRRHRGSTTRRQRVRRNVIVVESAEGVRYAFSSLPLPPLPQESNGNGKSASGRNGDHGSRKASDV